ncbi:MAG: hypothetical protein Kow0062_14070 [Acidobacteriota bacterium]
MKLFQRTRELEDQLDRFFDAVSESGLVLRAGVDDYLAGRADEFARRIGEMRERESRADDLRHEIENRLYAESLIPEQRGDVLVLLERLDGVLGQAKSVLKTLEVQQPEIPQPFADGLPPLVAASAEAIERIVRASRAFFSELEAVQNDVHKVRYFEKEADAIGTRLRRDLFAGGLELAHKMQLSHIVDAIEEISDLAEDAADALVIFAIKRSV